MVRLVLLWVNSPWAYELRPGLNKIGRNPTNDFKVSDPSVSSFHAEIFVGDGEIRVRDLGSTNGTFIDGVRVEEAVLKPENALKLGNVELRLDQVTVVETVSAAPNAAPGAKTETHKPCTYHPEAQSGYVCQNCGAHLCHLCIQVVGRDRNETMTRCPVCNGQCHALPSQRAPREKQPSLISRLTQTLKIPFAR